VRRRFSGCGITLVFRPPFAHYAEDPSAGSGQVGHPTNHPERQTRGPPVRKWVFMVKESQEKERGASPIALMRAPWETAPYGVVSLLAMLEFAARPYLELCHRFGLLLAQGKQPDPDVVKDSWTDLLKETVRLNLPVTREHITCFFEEMVKKNPTKVTFNAEGFEIKGAELPTLRVQHHVEAIYNTLRAEIGSILLRAIPKEKSQYLDEKWLTDTKIFEKSPEMVDEFHAAGRCFAYGENTACIFHLMRVVDSNFRRVADSIPGIKYDARSWQGIADNITKKMEQKYQTKTDDWKRQEPFYAAILTDIQAISRGHRNPALHELEKKYDEREATYMLTVIEGLARHVAEKL